jgi:tetratricopeptide (TPR) repeat protein
VAALLGELVGEHFPEAESVHLRAARADPSRLADALRQAWETLLLGLTARGPLVLALEDLHHADAPSVRLVDAALTRLRDRPFMVLALARPELSTLFPTLWAGRDVQELPLGPLSVRACERLARAVLPETEDLSVLVERAEGNPFFLEELARAVAEGRGDALPGSVVAMALARLEAAAPGARRVLRAASVYGRTFTAEGVEALSGELPVRPWLAELAAQEVLSRREGIGEGFAFRHALLREAAYSTLTDEDRALGHRLAGRWLESQGERDARVLAEHYARGHARPEAVRCSARAAWQCLDATDLEGALELARRAEALGAEGETLGSMLLCQLDAHRWRGEFAEVERVAAAAAARLAPWSPGWLRASWEGAVAAGRRGDTDRLSVLAEAVLGRGDSPGGAHDRSQHTYAARAAIHLLFAGRAPLAGRLLGALHAHRPDLSEDPHASALLDHARALEAHHAGDVETCLTLTLQASEGFAACGDARSACIQKVNAGYAYLQLGEHDLGVHTLREALTEAEARGLHHAAALARHNLGLGLLVLGLADEARVMERLAVDAFASQGDRRSEGGARMYLAQILLGLEDREGAAREAKEAAEVLQGSPPLKAQALATLGLSLTDPAERLQATAQAMTTLESEGAEEGEALVYRAHAEALVANARRHEALELVTRALAKVALRASRLRDPARAERFLRAVPDHARLRELSRELSEVTKEPGDRSPP